MSDTTLKADAVPLAVLTADILPVSQKQINRFGALMGTHGRIHTDPEFARTTPLGGVIVQGMLVLAPVHEAMVRLFGATRWLTGGHLESKIVAYTRPGEAARLTVTVERDDPSGSCGGFTIANDAGTTVLVGSFTVGSFTGGGAA